MSKSLAHSIDSRYIVVIVVSTGRTFIDDDGGAHVAWLVSNMEKTFPTIRRSLLSIRLFLLPHRPEISRLL